MIRLHVLLCCVILAGSPGHAQSLAESVRLEQCLEKADADPAAAYEDALAWMTFGSPPAARYCAARALVGLGRPDEAAARLETLATDREAGGIDQRAVLLAQAGNAWLLAGAPEAAATALTSAIRLRPRDGDLYVDRARASIILGHWDEAGRDLDAAVELSPGGWEAHLLRAAALRRAGRLQEAMDDIEIARKLAPGNTDVLVLRGEIADVLGRLETPQP
jgi:tetratricopeptide (TPR) repeat protein